MDSSVLAEAFTRLSTSDSRQNALEALLHQLTPYEWRKLKSLVNTRTFHFDIIGQLPVELVSQIFSYLDTTTPWRLQRVGGIVTALSLLRLLVSRSWFEKLQSLAVLKNSLDSWYDGAVNLQGADLDFCSRKARSVHAFRKPSWLAPPDCSFKITIHETYALGSTQLLVGDNLVWLNERDSRQVHVFNLRSWSSRIVQGAARERIQNICASDQILVLTTRSTIAYVARLDGACNLKRFRVPNAILLHIVTCRERTVACAGYYQESILVYIWNFDTQQGTSFNISHGDQLFSFLQPELADRQHGLALLLQPESKTITLCMIDAYPVDPLRTDPDGAHDIHYSSAQSSDVKRPRVLYSRYTYAGECLYNAERVLDEREHGLCKSFFEHGIGKRLRFMPAGFNGLFALQHDGWGSRRTTTHFPFQFDEQLQAFGNIPEHNLTGFEISPGTVLWKDTFLKAGSGDQLIYHCRTSYEPRHSPLLSSGDEPAGSRNFLLVNDAYVVRSYRDSFYIFCFDHTITLPEKEGPLGDWAIWEKINPNLMIR